METDALRQQRLRYLAAMGIDVYVRRSGGDEAGPTAAPMDVGASTAGAAHAEPAVAPGPGEGGAVDGGAVEGGAVEGAGIARARELLEADVAAPRARVEQDTGGDAAEVAGGAGSAVAGASADATVASPPGLAEQEDAPAEAEREAVAAPPPRFRLLALRCDSALLLVDEAVLPQARREALARLGDLLRAAMLRHAGARSELVAARRMETQSFFWPQVDAAHVDQSLPRAVEALSAWVRRCTADGEGCLLVLAPPPELLDAPAAAPLAALESLPVRRARIDANFLLQPGADSHRAAWRSLAALAGGGVTGGQ